MTEEDPYTGEDFPVSIKPNFPTLASVIEVSNQGSLVSFVQDDSIRILLGFDPTGLI